MSGDESFHLDFPCHLPYIGAGTPLVRPLAPLNFIPCQVRPGPENSIRTARSRRCSLIRGTRRRIGAMKIFSILAPQPGDRGICHLVEVTLSRGTVTPEHSRPPLLRNDGPPAAIVKHGWRDHHSGIPTRVPRSEGLHRSDLRIHVSGCSTRPYGIERIRFDPDCNISERVRPVPRIVFEVDDLDAAVELLEFRNRGKRRRCPPRGEHPLSPRRRRKNTHSW